MMTRFTLTFLLSTATVLYSQSLNLKGRILEKAGMLPVSGALVQLTGTNYKTLTGPDGHFTLTPTSSVSLSAHSSLNNLAPYLQGSRLLIEGIEKNQSVKVEFFSLLGHNISTATYLLNQVGKNQIALNNWPSDQFLGFVKINSAGVTSVLRVFSIPELGVKSTAKTSLTFNTHSNGTTNRALAKTSAGGTVEISMDKLIPKSVQATTDDADLGDIVLGYPTRTKIGVGASMPYGAEIFFDGSKGKVAAKIELDTKWEDWLPEGLGNNLYANQLRQFKIAKDPEFPNDANRATLQTCCDRNWGYDDMRTIKTHGDAQIHIEFNLMGEYDSTEKANEKDGIGPYQPGYNNSGVYIQSRYEVQIYSITQDSGYQPTNHEMGALVDDYIPLKNVNKPNGQWQSYDITFRQARYDANGNFLQDGYVTIWWNGVLVHDNRQAHAPATGLKNHSGEEMNKKEYGLKLQSEGTDVRYRNIWVKPLLLAEPKTNLGY